MSIFLEYKVDLGPKDEPVGSAWSATESVLAVALGSREVRFFQEEGNLAIQATCSRKAQVMKLHWQPKGHFLAVGWNDGGISLWNMKQRSSKDISSPHKTEIRLLEWAPYGNRLLTGDDSGLLVVWKIDARGNLSIATQYRRHGAITKCVFCTSAQQREREMRSETFAQRLCPSFFFAGQSGGVHYADDLGHITDVQNLSSAIEAMLFFEGKNRLVIITRNMLFMQLQVEDDGSVKPIMKVKLSVSTDARLRTAIWAGSGIMATASEESLVRFWDLGRDENYVLSLSSVGAGINRSDRVCSVSFNPRLRILAAGTEGGNVVFWKYGRGGAGQQSWEFLSHTQLKGKVFKLHWGNSQALLAVELEDGIYVMNRAAMHRSICNGVSVIQSSKRCISVESFKGGEITQSIIDCTMRIKSLQQDGKVALIHDGMNAEVYEFGKNSAKLVHEFKCDEDPVGIREDSFFKFQAYNLQICSLQGTIKHTISFTEGEGAPIVLDVGNKYVAVGTSRGLIKIFDISRRQPKAVGSSGRMNAKTCSSLGDFRFRSLRCNSDGSRVSILLDNVEGSIGLQSPSSKIYLFNVDTCTFTCYEFGDRYPVAHFWDPEEPRFLVCETSRDFIEKSPSSEKSKLERQESEESSPENEDEDASKKPKPKEESKSSLGIQESVSLAEREVATFFSTPEGELRMQDDFEMDKKHSCLLGVQVPHLFFAAKRDDDDDPENPYPKLRPKVMRDFVGLDTAERDIRAAMVDFSYYITIGNMDEAYRSVRLIENPSVWENMANMCVKTRRLDVAEVCLGNMGHARGAAALKKAKQEPEKEAAVAMVAVQLGLLDDAARLYRECNRYDLLNKLYRSAGYWRRALDVAHDHDRIHLKSTHYLYARHLEFIGSYNEAIRHYEEADMHHRDVPRMMYDRRKMNQLKNYIMEMKDKRLYKWWAQYMESNDELKKALQYYDRADDILSMVRVLCFKGDFDAAADLVQQSGSRVGAFHLARQFEASNEIQHAINFYSMAKCYQHSLRLAKENEMDTELMTFALLSDEKQMMETAEYFEQRSEYDKAVQLYQKAGQTSLALDLCFKAQLYDVLHLIADDLGKESSPAIVNKCADFFMSNGHYSKAVNLLITGNRLDEAINVCAEHEVQISEDMAERLTPPKSDNPATNAVRLELLKKLAKCCRLQGSYHLATKKYTQAGDKVKAMKCLLKSGDTEKVIFFAGVSRNKDIYILAANYLQNLDWRNDPEIMKNIITFYTKAKAFDQLSVFYDACGQTEIDEYRDYEKALHAFREAAKCLNKYRGEDKEEKIGALQQRIYLVEQFVTARNYTSSNPTEMVAMVRQLLDQPDIKSAIRIGDAYSMLVDYYYGQQNMEQAYQLIEKMRQLRIVIKPYIDIHILRDIHDKVGVPLPGDTRAERRTTEDDDDDIDEDIDEELEASMDAKD